MTVKLDVGGQTAGTTQSAHLAELDITLSAWTRRTLSDDFISSTAWRRNSLLCRCPFFAPGSASLIEPTGRKTR